MCFLAFAAFCGFNDAEAAAGLTGDGFMMAARRELNAVALKQVFVQLACCVEEYRKRIILFFGI